MVPFSNNKFKTEKRMADAKVKRLVRKNQVSDRKMESWIAHNLNVMFIGRHGVGKTARILEAFNRCGLKSLYFSGATLDPWIDFVGIPQKKIADNGNAYIDLIRPEALAKDQVHAIFIDEYNRCLTGDTKISLANGTEVAIRDLVGKDHFYVYAYNHSTGKIVIAKGHSARKTKKNAKLIKITLDNGESIRCTSNHPFLKKDGSYVQAGDLKSGDSLMPLYRKLAEDQKINLNGYEMVQQPDNLDWEFTHHLADDYNVEIGKYSEFRGSVRHHSDYNKLNNSPENIVKLSWQKHKELHYGMGKNGGINAHKKHPDLYERTIGSAAAKKKALENSIATRKTSKKYSKKRSKATKRYMNSGGREIQAVNCKSGWEKGQFNFDQKSAHFKRNITITLNWVEKNLSGRFTEQDYASAYEGNYTRGLISLPRIPEFFGSFENFVEATNNKVVVNHKVISVEFLAEKEDVYDITVDKHHNFALTSGIFVHNCHKKIRNAVMELIQFKSINGHKLNNLRMVWVAVNPEDDEEMSYDVEKIDPAQQDRFQIIVELPYCPDSIYFSKKFGKETAAQAIAWWNSQTEECQKEVSPRRLDMAIDHFLRNGDMNDVLPPSANISDFVKKIRESPKLAVMKDFIEKKDIDGAFEWISSEDNFSDGLKFVLDRQEIAFRSFWIPLFPEEKLSDLIQGNPTIFSFCIDNYAKFSRIEGVLKEIIQANINESLVIRLKKIMKIEEERSSASPVIPLEKNVHLENSDIAMMLKEKKVVPNFKTLLSMDQNIVTDIAMIDSVIGGLGQAKIERDDLYKKLRASIGYPKKVDDCLKILSGVEHFVSRIQDATIKTKYDHLIRMVNAAIDKLDSFGYDLNNVVIEYPGVLRVIKNRADEFLYSK